jgi:hypothetical protein
LRKSFSWMLSMALMGVLISWLMVEIAWFFVSWNALRFC